MVYPDGRIIEGDTDILVSLSSLQKIRLSLDLSISAWSKLNGEKEADSKTTAPTKGDV